VSHRLIDHEPEGRTDKVIAMRGHSVAEARLPLLALFGHGGMSDLSPLCAQQRTWKKIMLATELISAASV
jgi:hypothetical protein